MNFTPQPQPTGKAPSSGRFAVHSVGGPTALLELGGLRLLTDPTFDPPQEYPIGQRSLMKTSGPARSPGELGSIDVVLLSHDQHPDNLDSSGREVANAAPLVLTTTSGAARLGGTAVALANWQHRELVRPDGGTIRITGLPAQHGPDGSEHLVGEVTGFLLSGESLPTVYISGDNASLDVVRTVAERCGPVDVVLLFAGGARTALLGDAYLTLSSEGAAEAARILGARQVIPLHVEGWAHFSQGPESLAPAFDRAGLLDRLIALPPGQSITL